MKFGLENMLFFDQINNFPSSSFLSIHVGGTNGKGSTSYKIARSLQIAERKVGLYTSPHISTVCERIQINGEPISEEEMASFLEDIFFQMETHKRNLTFFEVMTLLCFLYFRKNKVDVAVIEVGMGGRLDATNIIKPLLSIITSIGYDHKQYLGNSLEEISCEKGGIIKQGIPVLLGPKATHQKILHRMAALKESPCYFIKEEKVSFEEENTKIAQTAIDILPFKTYCQKALLLIPPCRFELFNRGEKQIILDGGHNPPAIEALLQRLESHFPSFKGVFILGFSADKDVETMLDLIKEKASMIILTKASHARAYNPHLGVSYLKKQGFERCLAIEEIDKAYDMAVESHSFIVATGTFYIMKELRKRLGILEKSDDHIFPF